MKRVLFLVENAPVPDDRRVWNQACTLRQAGYRVAIICPRRRGARPVERVDGISIYRFPLPSMGGFVGHLVEYGLALPIIFALTCAVFVKEGFDVIHVANPPDFLYLIARPFTWLGRKFVFDQHDVVPETCEVRWSGVKRRFALALARAAERASFRHADVVIAPNGSVRALAVGRGGVDPSRTFVVRNAIRRGQFEGRPRTELRRGKPYLLCYTGVIGPQDGLEVLVRAIYHLAVERGRRDVHVVVIGDGDCFAEVVALRDQLGLQETIEFTGWIRDDRLIADYLATADVCLVPDPKNPMNDFCSMNKIVEYLAMGKPVVAFDLMEAQETAQDAGVYVRSSGDPQADARAFGDQVIELLDAPAARERMGTYGRRRFDQVLAWDHQREALLRAYTTLLAAPSIAPLPPSTFVTERRIEG
jgi:glycosyltransferase involved in cell wall biosynthesis